MMAFSVTANDSLRAQLRSKISNNKKNSYSRARQYLFNELSLKRDKSGHYYMRGVYCDNIYTANTPNIGKFGRGRIPNHEVVNCEHTWPQSKFIRRSDSKMQKGDLHHLFPTDTHANSVRSSNDFGEVRSGKSAGRNCSSSKTDGKYFEPADYHKGNVARAMFYFAIRYNGKINPRMEAYLRKWHEQDPVDLDEIERNNKIEKIQGNRNPFIDNPELVSRIRDF